MVPIKTKYYIIYTGDYEYVIDHSYRLYSELLIIRMVTDHIQ